MNSAHRPSAGTVIAMIALVCALAGSAVALPGKNKVDKNDLKKGAVTKKAIKAGAVTAKAIKAGAVTAAAIADGSVTSPKIADGSVTAAKVEEDSLTTADIADAGASGLKKVTATPGASFAAARSAAPPQPLLTRGALTVYGKCFTDTSGPTTYGYVYISTTEAGSVFTSGDDSLFGSPFLDPTTPEVDRVLFGAIALLNSATGDRSEFDAAAPSGSSMNGLVTVYAKHGTLAAGNGIYGAGNTCLLAAAELG